MPLMPSDPSLISGGLSAFNKSVPNRDETGYATRDFKELLGRDPTPEELAMIVPAYIGADPHTPNVAGGKAFIAQFAQNERNNPEAVYKRKQEQYLKDAPQHYGTIDQLFQTGLGRGATDQEKAHFGSMLASGQIDPYTLGTYLQQLPEAVKQQDEQFRKGLTSDLQGQDQRYFQENILPSIQSSFAKAGRSVDSSGYAAALAQAANQQNLSREGFLRDLTASQYGGSQARAREDYMGTVARQYGLQDYSRARTDQLSDMMTQRMFDIDNYNRQKSAYDQYLSRYGKRSSGLGRGIGSLAGMGLGALLAAPTGGMSLGVGAMLGGTAGGTFGGLFDQY